MWKDKLIEFSKKFEHPAWGYSHSIRVYEMSLQLARQEKLDVDEDSLFAASYLHDIGAFDPYRKEGLDHSEASIQHCEEILRAIEFTPEKIQHVKEIIKTHMYYREPTDLIEAILFHDADTLDFMGIIGITRLLSIIGIDDWTPNLKHGIKLIKKFIKNLPNALQTSQAREIGNKRQEEMKDFMQKLSNETGDLKTL